MKSLKRLTFLSSLLIGGLLLLPACTANVSAQDIQGLLQAMQGKEMIVTLADGSTVRIAVEDAQSAATAQRMVGQPVNVKVRVSGDDRRLENVQRVGEDEHFTGVIQSMSADSWVIGGKTFKVDANTELDGGLAVGVTARVEFVTQADNTLLATEIETDDEDEKFKGSVQSTNATAWVIGGQTFKVNTATRIDAGLTVGSAVRVHFITQPDGSFLAIKIESDQPQNHFAGVIQTINADSWTIGGRTFVVNDATRLDDGLAVGVKARVEFITLTDGTMLATKIETDEAEDKLSGTVSQVSATAWVVDNRTFSVTAATRIDSALGVGSRVRIRFTTLANGSMLATRIQADNRGTGNQDDFQGTVESISADKWVISSQNFTVTAATRIDSGLAVGSKVRVRFNRLADGSRQAIRIEADKRGRDAGNAEQEEKKEPREAQENARFTGVIESITADKWVIGGKTFTTDNSTKLDNGLSVGVQAKVEFVTQADGSLLAREIETAK
ncbi:MAG: hypothetical protein HY663_06425 [Chloroflexi bacterium]|nr:hypothetical protein [Chloroflexota bacterium]